MASTYTDNADSRNHTAMTQTGTFIAMNDPNLRLVATGLPTRIEAPPNSGVMAGGIGYYPETSQSQNLDEIMTVPVTITKSKSETQLAPANEKQGFMGKIKNFMGSSLDKREEKKLRIVYMPRREYLKYFAKDKKRNYIGTEPERSWTDDELDLMFGQYEPAAPQKPKSTLGDALLTPLSGNVQL